MSAVNEVVTTVIEALNTCFGVLVICFTGVSHSLQAILHVFCLPLKFFSTYLHNVSRIILLRLGWAPVLFGMKIANLKMDVTHDEHVKNIDCLGLAFDEKTKQLYLPDNRNQYIPEFEGKNKFLVMANHQAYADTFFVAFFLNYFNSADGSMMWFIWKTFLFIPLGWASYMAGHVFLGGGKDDESTLINYLQDFKKSSFRTLCLYPEGAIRRPKLQEKANVFAKREGFPEMNNVMLPRVVAFCACVRAMREAGGEKILDITLGFPEKTQWKNEPNNLVDLAMFHPEPVRVCMHIREFSLDEIGETDEQIRDWLFQKYEEKDKLLDYFNSHQKFPGLVADCTPTFSRILCDCLIWLPFIILYMYMIGLAGINFAYVAMTLYYIFWSTGASLYTSLGMMWVMWIGGLLASALAVIFLPAALVPISTVSYQIRRKSQMHHLSEEEQADLKKQE